MGEQPRNVLNLTWVEKQIRWWIITLQVKLGSTDATRLDIDTEVNVVEIGEASVTKYDFLIPEIAFEGL